MTKIEAEWVGALQQVGCIVCLLTGLGKSPPEIHHFLSGGRRLGHRYTLPLCLAHHRGGRCDEQCVSRHPHKRAFENRYGTELKLWHYCRKLVVQLGLMKEAPPAEDPPANGSDMGDDDDVEREAPRAQAPEHGESVAALAAERGTGEAGADAAAGDAGR